MNLVDILLDQTQELRTAYIKETVKWSTEEYGRLKLFVKDYQNNYDCYKSKKYYSLPSCVVNQRGTVEEYIDLNIKKAEKHYDDSIIKLALRIEKKGLDLDKLEVSTSYLDPNISTTITDGVKNVCAYTIIAGGNIQRPHYRYLVK